MATGRSFRVVTVVGAGLAALVVLSVGLALAGPSGPVVAQVEASECETHVYGVYPSSGDASNVPALRKSSYENLTAKQRAVVDRALEHPGGEISISADEWAVMQEAPDVIRHEERDVVYRTQLISSDCPVAPGLPVALNPVLVPLALFGTALLGPLSPLLAIGLVAGVGYTLVQYRGDRPGG